MEFLSICATNKNKVVAIETSPTAILFGEVISEVGEKNLFKGQTDAMTPMRISIAVRGERLGLT